MPTNFPTSPDDIQNDVNNSTLEVDLHPGLHNQLADAVMAIEAELLAGGTMNLAAHVAAADPHAGYLTQAEGDARYDASGAAVAGDSAHAGAADPHPSYLTQAEGDARYAQTPIVVPAGSITGAMLADGTVDTADLKDGAVTSAKILDGTIVAGDIADGTITSAKIADGTIATADLANLAVTNAKMAADTARANLLTNGGFEVWQRGAGPMSTNGAYTADRWQIVLAGTDALSVSRDLSANRDAGSHYSLLANFVLGTGGGGTHLRQEIKQGADAGGWARGRTITVSMRIKTSTANCVRVGVNSDGTGAPSATSAAHTGSNQFETLTATVTVAADATNLVVAVTFAATGAAWIDNAMLVMGTVPAEYAPLHPADDLARCQRYFEVGAISGRWYTTASQIFESNYPMKTQKAVTPTVTITAGTRNNIASTSPRTVTTNSVSYTYLPTSANIDTYFLTESYSIEANP